VFGFALLAMSQGAYALRDTWVMLGLLIFVGLVLVAEGVLWPAERRLQEVMVEPLAQGTAPEATVLADARLMQWSASGCIVLLVVGSALMLAQP
jgi:hypothetical protein